MSNNYKGKRDNKHSRIHPNDDAFMVKEGLRLPHSKPRMDNCKNVKLTDLQVRELGKNYHIKLTTKNTEAEALKILRKIK